MKREIKILDIKELQDEWKHMDNSLELPYQAFEFTTSLPISTSPRDALHLKDKKELNVTLWKDDICSMILPYTIEEISNKHCEIHLRGYDYGGGLLGVLYNCDVVYEDFEFSMNELIRKLQNVYEGCIFKLGRIKDEKLISWLDNFLTDVHYCRNEQKCVAINVPNEYQLWYAALSKSMRQNVRTMYNRIDTDTARLETKVYIRQRVDVRTYGAIQKMYAKRTIEKNNWNQNIPGIKWTVYMLKKHNGFVKALNNENNSFHSVIYLNGTIVAFMSGVIANNSELIIPHLAYDSNYKRYSPGILLVSETIKYLAEHKEYKVLDLSCGSEEYKYTLGGLEYLVYEYIFEV